MKKQGALPRAFVVANPIKGSALSAFEMVKGWLDRRGQLAGADYGLDPDAVATARPDRIIVLGGDGTILAAGRSMGAHQVPIIGVNLGKLGYLAAYSVEDLRDHLAAALTDAALVSERMTLEVSVRAADGTVHKSIAINDCVILAGAPFRVLSLDLAVDNQPLTTIVADGLIIATPTGSTAHNMSAGGPILEPQVDAFAVTPICPHSLTHRPIVMAPTNEIAVSVHRANEGTTAIIDGQLSIPAHAGTVVSVRRGPDPFRLVRHPARTSWQGLVYKLKWGTRPA